MLDESDHCYRVFEPCSGDAWLSSAAAAYVELRTVCAVPLSDISLDGIGVFDTKALKARLAEALVPVRRGGNFDVVRSDFGEVLAYAVLEEEFGTRFACKIIQDRELVHQPGRGIDAVGVEDGDPLRLVLAEVKVSADKESPPDVVDKKKDALRPQHLSHVKNLDATISKVFDRARRAVDWDVRNLHLRAVLLLQEGRLDLVRIIVASVLIRPSDLYQQTDFGTFRAQPADYAPARVRFLILRIPGTVDGIVQDWYENHVKKGAA